ncbi:MAG: aryl-sulfate sulfotransferase [Spartobacteria bacterium]
MEGLGAYLSSRNGNDELRFHTSTIRRGRRANMLDIAGSPGELRPVKLPKLMALLAVLVVISAQAAQLTVPVFGLYAGRSNTVTITVRFRDGTSQVTPITIVTLPTMAAPIPAQPLSNHAFPALAGSYDFILIKGYADPITPIVIDTDGEVRWIGTANISTQDVEQFDNAFYLGSGSSLFRTEFDGSTTEVANYSSLGVIGFHHNIDLGKMGILLDVDTVNDTECVNLEVDKDVGRKRGQSGVALI